MEVTNLEQMEVHYDNLNTVIFPLKSEEIMLLLHSKEQFENYLNVKFDAQDLQNESVQNYFLSFVQKQKEMDMLDFCTDLFVIVSAQDKCIVGTIANFDNSIYLFFNDNYLRTGSLFASINLFIKREIAHNKKVFSVIVNNKKEYILALENNGFECTTDKTEQTLMFKRSDREI